MNKDLKMTDELGHGIGEIVKLAIKEALKEHKVKEWMTLKEGADYAGVAFNTFKLFVAQGLKISCPTGVTRKFVSRTEIDRFLNEHSF